MSITSKQTGPPRRRPGDLVFSGTTRAAALVILVTLAGVAVFLTIEGLPALGAKRSDLSGAGSFWAYAGALVFGTLRAALIALVIATPLSIAVALVVSHYAPRKLAALLGYLVDLLAAVPSVVYGLWGIGFLAPRLVPPTPGSAST